MEEAKTCESTLFEFTLPSVLFRAMFKLRAGLPTEVSFDGGKTWENARNVYAAMAAFQDRYPLDLDEKQASQ